MDIRRIEPDLIRPPAASEHGARVVNPRRQREQPHGNPGHPHDAPDETPEEQPSHQEHDTPPVRTYQPDGHVHEEGVEHERHAIDFTA